MFPRAMLEAIAECTQHKHEVSWDTFFRNDAEEMTDEIRAILDVKEVLVRFFGTDGESQDVQDWEQHPFKNKQAKRHFR